jgi:thioesterase domain-containing protein
MLSQAVKELENRLLKLNDISYHSIDRLMRKIMKSYDVTAKELHDAFKQKNKKTPDDWIKRKMNKLQNKSISEEFYSKNKSFSYV